MRRPAWPLPRAAWSSCEEGTSMTTHAISTVWPGPGGAAPTGARTGRAPEPSRLGFRALMALMIVVLFAPQAWLPPLGEIRPALLAVLVGLTAVVVERLKH